MAGEQPDARTGNSSLTFEKALTPIFVFAIPNAILCWSAAWLFRETYAFSATLLGVGCLPIIVGICAYLVVLINKVERGD